MGLLLIRSASTCLTLSKIWCKSNEINALILNKLLNMLNKWMNNMKIHPLSLLSSIDYAVLIRKWGYWGLTMLQQVKEVHLHSKNSINSKKILSNSSRRYKNIKSNPLTSVISSLSKQIYQIKNSLVCLKVFKFSIPPKISTSIHQSEQVEYSITWK